MVERTGHQETLMKKRQIEPDSVVQQKQMQPSFQNNSEA
jgi:hypothetical protein